MQLLLIEDDPALQTTLQRTLQRKGFRVEPCTDGRLALERWKQVQPDVVVLDLSLPGLDGLEVLALARKNGLVAPVLILTARGTVGDRIIGLNTGADDYLAKPFDLDELEARVRALARRGSGRESGRDSEAAHRPAFAGLQFDATSGAVYLNGQAMELSSREAALLRALLATPGRAVSKERLSDLVFAGETQVQADAIEVVVYRLRKKLIGVPTQLVTLRGLGYLLKAST